MAQQLQAAMAGSAPLQQQPQPPSIASLLQLQGQLAAVGHPGSGLAAAQQQQQLQPATSARAVPTSAFEGMTGLSLGAINLSAGQAGDLLRAVGAGQVRARRRQLRLPLLWLDLTRLAGNGAAAKIPPPPFSPPPLQIHHHVQPGTLQQLAGLLAAGGSIVGGGNCNGSLQWPPTGLQRQQAASTGAGVGGGLAAAPSVSKEDTTTSSGALVQHGNNLMLGNDSELPALSADGGMEGLHGGLAAFDSNRNMRRNPKQQMQNKQAQARYRYVCACFVICPGGESRGRSMCVACRHLCVCVCVKTCAPVYASSFMIVAAHLSTTDSTHLLFFASRERQKSKLVDMERTISELQAKVSAMQALETSYRNLEVNSRGMQAELAAKEQEIVVLRSSMQVHRHMVGSFRGRA